MIVGLESDNRLKVGKGCIISFRRTLKIAEDELHSAEGTPVFDNLPLLKVSEFKDKLPESWVNQNGVIIALHDHEAIQLSLEGTEHQSNLLYNSNLHFRIQLSGE